VRLTPKSSVIAFSVGKRDPGGISPVSIRSSKRWTRSSASDAALVATMVDALSLRFKTG
jgi:hypothetical protein